MAKSYRAERVRGTADHELPPSLCREIGRIITRWAYFEHVVQEMNWQMLDLSAAEGRIAMREPRVTDRLEMLNDLKKMRNAQWDEQLYKDICSQAKLTEAKRHLVTHGKWMFVQNTGEWHVELARGSWPKKFSELIKGSRKITPESVALNVTSLRSATTEIDGLIADLKRLRASATGAPRPSPERLA